MKVAAVPRETAPYSMARELGWPIEKVTADSSQLKVPKPCILSHSYLRSLPYV